MECKELILPEQLASVSGTEIITPLLVPIQSRFEDISKLVIRTREKPNLPVPTILSN